MDFQLLKVQENKVLLFQPQSAVFCFGSPTTPTQAHFSPFRMMLNMCHLSKPKASWRRKTNQEWITGASSYKAVRLFYDPVLEIERVRSAFLPLSCRRSRDPALRPPAPRPAPSGTHAHPAPALTASALVSAMSSRQAGVAFPQPQEPSTSFSRSLCEHARSPTGGARARALAGHVPRYPPHVDHLLSRESGSGPTREKRRKSGRNSLATSLGL